MGSHFGLPATLTCTITIVYEVPSNASFQAHRYPVFPPGCSPPFLTWLPLMWSLECLICFDLMEKLYFPPLFFFYLGETLGITRATDNYCDLCLALLYYYACLALSFVFKDSALRLTVYLFTCFPYLQGTLIQHLKEHLLHGNMNSNDVIFYYTTVSVVCFT